MQRVAILGLGIMGGGMAANWLSKDFGVTVWNRTEGDMGQRLNDFTLRLLDNDRREIYRQNGIPAPKPQATDGSWQPPAVVRQ